MVLDGIDADVQFFRNARGGQAFGTEVDDFYLPSGKAQFLDGAGAFFGEIGDIGSDILRDKALFLAQEFLATGADGVLVLDGRNLPERLGYLGVELRTREVFGNQAEQLLLAAVGSDDSAHVHQGQDDDDNQRDGQDDQRKNPYAHPGELHLLERGFEAGFHFLQARVSLLLHVILRRIDILLMGGGGILNVSRLGIEHHQVVPALALHQVIVFLQAIQYIPAAGYSLLPLAALAIPAHPIGQGP